MIDENNIYDEKKLHADQIKRTERINIMTEKLVKYYHRDTQRDTEVRVPSRVNGTLRDMVGVRRLVE